MDEHDGFQRVLIPSDDGPVGEEPQLEIFATLDWYIGVRLPEQRFCMHAVRFNTSGSRDHRMALCVALMHACARNDEQRIRELSATIGDRPWK